MLGVPYIQNSIHNKEATGQNKSIVYLAPSLATASEANYGVGLHMGNNVLQVLHVGCVISACHDLLVLGQLISSAGGHQALAITHVDVLQASGKQSAVMKPLLSHMQTCCMQLVMINCCHSTHPCCHTCRGVCSTSVLIG